MEAANKQMRNFHGAAGQPMHGNSGPSSQQTQQGNRPKSQRPSSGRSHQGQEEPRAPRDQQQQQQQGGDRPAKQSRPPRPQQQQGQGQQAGPSSAPAMPAPAPASSTREQPLNAVALAHQSSTRFADLDISPLTKRALAEVFRYEFCTNVQAQSLPVCLTGQDVLAKAKTGTGKTLGFMIPVIEQLLRRRPAAGQVGALVLSPTRELAMQIYQEATKLLHFHNLTVQVVIGGTNINSEANRLRNSTPHILVATPGRCLDHLTNPDTGLEGMMRGLQMLVCDEADNILDMGFRPTIEKILARLPPPARRQALLFSATFPEDVKQLANVALRVPYATVDTVGEETHTNVQVEQYSCVVPHADTLLYLYAVIAAHMQQDPEYKVIAFFPTARVTQLFSELFEAAGMHVLEMHSRKSQAHRTRMSDEFRRKVGVVMFSSDVSARGVDYPDVTLVVQVGLPTDRTQYVHRVGRTARAGKAGQSLLLLADFEAGFLRQLSGLPIKTLGALPPPMLQQAAPVLQAALPKVPYETKSKAYAAWLGFYKSAPGLSMPVPTLINTANEFSSIIGCPEPPELEAKTVGKMGLKGVPGLRIAGRGMSGRR